MNVAALIALAQALTPIVEGGIVGVEHVVAAVKAVRPDAEVDADLRALVAEALAAKAEADAAATDPTLPGL